MTVEINVKTGVNSLDEKRKGFKCNPAQMRIVLLRLGKLDEAEAIISTNSEANIAWQYASQITWDSPIVSALRRQAFTESELDEIFCSAIDIIL